MDLLLVRLQDGQRGFLEYIESGGGVKGLAEP
jgi:hypothetical protein